MRKPRPLKIPKRERRDTAARLMPKMRSGEISVERFFAETESDFVRLADALMRRFDLPASVGVEDVAQELRILTMKKIAAWKPEGGVNLSNFVFFAANEKTQTWLNRQREAPRVRGAASRYPLLLLDAVEREERESMLDKVKGSLESPEDEAIAHLDGDAPIGAERRFALARHLASALGESCEDLAKHVEKDPALRTRARTLALTMSGAGR